MASNIREIVTASDFMPELSPTDVADAVLAARCLCAGGLRVIEFSMRTAVAPACIEAVRKALPEATVGAGSLTRAVDFAAADRAGAQFGSTPGLTAELAAASRGARFPLLPGVMTPTEVITARHAGFMVQKLIFAHQSAELPMLKYLHNVFPDVAFVVSGDYTAQQIAEYLQLPNVVGVAGSWAALRDPIAGGDWPLLEARSRQVAGLRRDAY